MASSSIIREWELWACAHHYVREHGEDTAILAAMRSDKLLAEGDIDGARTFRLIVGRIALLVEKLDQLH